MRASSVSRQGFMPQQALGQHGKPLDALSLIHLPPAAGRGAQQCSEPAKLDRFWLEFSAVIPWLGGAESDESQSETRNHFFIPNQLNVGHFC
jgi:hypothetical protein